MALHNTCTIIHCMFNIGIPFYLFALQDGGGGWNNVMIIKSLISLSVMHTLNIPWHVRKKKKSVLMLAESLNNGLVTGGFWEAETQALISAHPPPFVSESCHMIRETAQRRQIRINNNNNNTKQLNEFDGACSCQPKEHFSYHCLE